MPLSEHFRRDEGLPRRAGRPSSRSACAGTGPSSTDGSRPGSTGCSSGAWSRKSGRPAGGRRSKRPPRRSRRSATATCCASCSGEIDARDEAAALEPKIDTRHYAKRQDDLVPQDAGPASGSTPTTSARSPRRIRRQDRHGHDHRKSAILVHLATKPQRKARRRGFHGRAGGTGPGRRRPRRRKGSSRSGRAVTPGPSSGKARSRRSGWMVEELGRRPGRLRPQPQPHPAAEPGKRPRSCGSSTGPSSSSTSSPSGPARARASSRSSWPSSTYLLPRLTGKGRPCRARRRHRDARPRARKARRWTAAASRTGSPGSSAKSRTSRSGGPGSGESRRESLIPLVSLVGYTSVGKSTLFNRLAQENAVHLAPALRHARPARAAGLVSGRAELFPERHRRLHQEAARSSSSPPSRPPSRRSTKPTSSSTSSTSASPGADGQTEAVTRILAEIGAADIPRLNVYNKIDRLPDASESCWPATPARTERPLRLGGHGRRPGRPQKTAPLFTFPRTPIYFMCGSPATGRTSSRRSRTGRSS